MWLHWRAWVTHEWTISQRVGCRSRWLSQAPHHGCQQPLASTCAVAALQPSHQYAAGTIAPESVKDNTQTFRNTQDHVNLGEKNVCKWREAKQSSEVPLVLEPTVVNKTLMELLVEASLELWKKKSTSFCPPQQNYHTIQHFMTSKKWHACEFQKNSQGAFDSSHCNARSNLFNREKFSNDFITIHGFQFRTKIFARTLSSKSSMGHIHMRGSPTSGSHGVCCINLTEVSIMAKIPSHVQLKWPSTRDLH